MCLAGKDGAQQGHSEPGGKAATAQARILHTGVQVGGLSLPACRRFRWEWS